MSIINTSCSRFMVCSLRIQNFPYHTGYRLTGFDRNLCVGQLILRTSVSKHLARMAVDWFEEATLFEMLKREIQCAGQHN